jgi:hypothetical protein
MASVISVTSSRNRVPPWAATSRPGLPTAPVNAPFFVAEQFVGQQFFVEGAAVHRQEWTVGTTTV